MIDDEKTPKVVIADAHYQLAAMRDKAGQYDEALTHLVQAKKILSNAAATHSDEAWAIGRQSGKTIATLKAEHCDRWAAAGSELTPFNGKLALLASHPRSGTTLLEQVLDSHPGAISADELQIMSDMVYLPLGQKAQPGDPIPERTRSDLARRLEPGAAGILDQHGRGPARAN